MVDLAKSDNDNDRHYPNDHSLYNHLEMQTDSAERYEKLFKKLDINGDGYLDIEDVTTALQNMGMSENVTQAKEVLRRHRGTMGFKEFSAYMNFHEKKLLTAFQKFDVNKDGKIDVEEVQKTFLVSGIILEHMEAKNLLARMDRDGNHLVNFDEWRDYLLFHPTLEIADILKTWRHATVLDIGENNVVPDDFTETELVTGLWWRHLVAGGIAGAVSRTCTAPLDRIKMFLQVHGKRQFGSINGCLKYMLQEGGIKSLWRGNAVNVLKIAPETALKFMAYEQAKRLIRGTKSSELTMPERFIAGSLAGGVSQTAIYPLEVLKTRLALRKTGQYKNAVDAITKIYQQEGFRCFYRGYVPNLLGIIPYAGIDLAVYETLKKVYLRRHQTDDNDPGVLVLLACGTISSTMGQITSYPLALVRTRLQAQAVVADLKGDTMTGLFRSILQTEGLVGLYRGIAPNFLKVAPAVSISYVVYERTRQALGVTMT